MDKPKCYSCGIEIEVTERQMKEWEQGLNLKDYPIYCRMCYFRCRLT